MTSIFGMDGDDNVLCTDASGSGGALRKGETYVVDWVQHGRVGLVGVEDSWDCSRFRRIQPRRERVLELIKNYKSEVLDGIDAGEAEWLADKIEEIYSE